MDWQVQSLFNTLESAGVLNDTLIVYSSDNGPWEAMCEFGGSPGPFVGTWQRSPGGGGGGSTSKLTTWEGGHRVPTMAHWPGKIAPGVTAAMGSHLDILPTFMALAGAPLPTDRHFDGMDMSPVLFDGAQALHDTLFHGESIGGELTAWRWHQYKAYSKTYAVGACNSTAEDMQLLRSGSDDDNGEINVKLWKTPLIFDVASDPAESTPLQDVDPRLVKQLLSVHSALMSDIRGSAASQVDWTMGWESVYPCCNPNHVKCRCED